MKRIPNISESELEVMKLLWKNSPLTSKEIIEGLEDHKDWSDNTIKTFINRLLNKGAIRNEKCGRRYLYFSNIRQEDFISLENKSFLKTIYDGAVGKLLSKFIEDEDLTEEDIEQLQRILEEKKSR